MISNIRVDFCGIEDMDYKGDADFTHIKTLPHFSVVQSLKGNYSIQIGSGREYITPDGGMFIAPPQYLQKITHLLKNGEIYARWIFLNIEIDNAYSAELLYDFPVIPPAEEAQRLNDLLDLAFQTDDLCDRMSISYQITKILLSLAKEKNTVYSKALLGVLDYIKNNYTEKITVSQLAALVHISESNLYASFKKQFGMPPIAYLNDYRLVMGSKFLKSSSASIEDISRSVGIDDVRYFSKIFKRKFNSTPSAYRKLKV